MREAAGREREAEETGAAATGVAVMASNARAQSPRCTPSSGGLHSFTFSST